MIESAMSVVPAVGQIWVAGIQAYAEMYRRPTIPASWPHPAEWLELPQRTQGDPIPVVFGTVWIREPHVFWVRDLHTQSMKVSSGGGTQTIGRGRTETGFALTNLKRRFCAGLGMVLCQGPLDSVARIDVADQLLAGDHDFVTNGVLLDLSSGPEEIEVWDPHIFAASQLSAPGEFYDDGVAGRLGVAPGLTDQSGLVIPRWGTDKGNLRGISTVWFRGPGSDFDWDAYDAPAWQGPLALRWKDGGVYDHPYAFYLGASPELRPWSFLVTRCTGRNGGITQWYAAKAQVDTYYDLAGARVYDMNPVHVLVELLCDPFWGLDRGGPGDVIDSTSFEAMADVFAAGGTGIGVSWIWDRETHIANIVQEIERTCDVVLEHEPSDNKWHLRWWQSTTTPVEIGDSDIVEFESSIPASDELPTTIHVTWNDRRRGREQTYILQDLAALYVRGREIVHYWNASMVASPVTVPQLARRALSRLVTPQLTVEVTVLRTDAIAALRQTDPVTLTSTEHGISGTFRVAEWNHGVRDNGTVRLTLIQEPDADSDTSIWHEPGDPTDPTPSSLPDLTFAVEEMPLHVWWAIDNVPDLPERLWAEGSDIDQITRLWMWATRPTDRWDLDGWRWADRLIDDSGSPEGYVTVSPELSPFSATFEVTTLNRGNDRVGTDTLEHDGTKVLRVGDILAVPHTDETPIVVLDSSGLSLADRGNLATRDLNYSQMDGAYEFLIVTEVVDSTTVTVLGGLWDTLPAQEIGGTSLVVGHYPIISPWDSAPDELQIGGAGQVRRAPPTIGSPLNVRDAVQTAALSVSGGRIQAFDDITPLDVPLSGADVPSDSAQNALVRPIRPLVGGGIELFEIEAGANSRVAITVEPRTRDSRHFAPSSLALTGITDGTQRECCIWPDDDPPLILWVIDPSSGDVIATRPWTTSYSSGELAFLNSDEKALHNTIHGGSQLFEELTFIVTADAALIEAPPGTLKSIHSWQYIRFDVRRAVETATAEIEIEVAATESYTLSETATAEIEIEVTATEEYDSGLTEFEEEIDGYSPIHWWRFDEGSGTAITDYGSEGADMTASAGTDNVLSWESVPSALGFDTALRVTNTDHAAENVNGGGTMSGAPGFDLVSDFTLVWFGRYPGEGAGTLTAFYTKTVGGDIEEFLISVNADTETLQVNFYDDTNTVRTISWKWTTGVGDPTWWMFAITWDADGGTGGDPLITLYQFDSESGHSVRSETWDPGHTPNALGDNTPQSDFAVGGLEYVDVEDDEFVEWAHYVVFDSVLTEQNLKDIAALGLAWEEWTAQAAPDVNDVTETTTSSGTSHSIDMPATVDEGDLLLMVLAYEGADTLITGPTGWSEVMLDDGAVNAYTIAAYSKMADGTEGGTTVSVSTSSSKIMHAQVHRVDKGTWYGSSDSSDAVDGVDSLTTNAGVTAAHDHPALSPSWAAANLPWLALTVTFNPDQTKSVSTEATGYANGAETVSGTANLATARKDVEGTSEDPSGFTWDANGGSVGTTLGVRPALSVPVEGTESFIESLSPDVWLDASDLSTLFQNVAGSTAVTSDDDPVRYWADKSGNGRYFRAVNDSGTNVYKATGFNGLPCVRTSGASNLMYTVSSWAHGTPCTILMAFHNRDTSGTKYVIQQGTAGPIRVFFAADAATGTGPGFYEASGGHAAFGTSILTDEDAFAVVFGDSDQARLYQQDTLFGSWTDFTDFNQTEEQRLFSSNGDCDLAEYIFIPRELTTEEREAAMSYLVNKWSL